MLIVCPSCGAQTLPPKEPVPGLKLRCSHCRAVFRLQRKEASSVKLLLAHESTAFCDAVAQVLAAEPFRLYLCHDGEQALSLLRTVRPQLLLLDVALPGRPGFEICDLVRADRELSGIGIVLISSVYDKTRYKRAPVSLYGADDYIEKHHIPDGLLPKLRRLLGGGLPADPRALDPAPIEATRSELRREEVAQSPISARQEPAKLREQAGRLARVVASDLLLYNQDRLSRGARQGNLEWVLARDLREGELWYRQRVPAELQRGNPVQDAFHDLMTKMLQCKAREGGNTESFGRYS